VGSQYFVFIVFYVYTISMKPMFTDFTFNTFMINFQYNTITF